MSAPGRHNHPGRNAVPVGNKGRSTTGADMQRHRVVVIGAGFGGLFAIKALRNAPVDITLINGTAYHLFQPLLYQVATGILSEGEIAPPIREVLRGQDNVDVRLGWAEKVDVETKT